MPNYFFVLKGYIMVFHQIGLNQMHPDKSSCLNLSANAQMGWQISGYYCLAFCKTTFHIVPPKMNGLICIGLP